MTCGAQFVRTTPDPTARTRGAGPTSIDQQQPGRRGALPDIQVVLVTTSFPLRPGTTSAPFIQRLAEHLGDRIRLTVVTPADSNPAAVTSGARYRVRAFRYAPRRWQVLAQVPGGIPVALARRPLTRFLLPGMLASMFGTTLQMARHADLLHANWSAVGLIAGWAGRLTGTPVITTLRGSDLHRLDASGLSRLVLRLCLQLSDRVVCVSDHLAETVLRHYPWAKTRLCVIPNGVADGFLRVQPATNNPDGTLRLVCVGNLIPGKRVDTILRAVANTKDLATQLTIVGDGPERAGLQALAAELGIGDRVSFAGRQHPDAMAELLAGVDTFILASASEGRSNALLEAMAAGLPIIGSEIPGISELIRNGDNGLLFPTGDAAALAAAIRRLADDARLRAELGTRARSTILARELTWDRCADRYIELYSELLSQHQRQE